MASAKKRALGRLMRNDVALAAMRRVLLTQGFNAEAAELAAHTVIKPSLEKIEDLARIIQRQGKQAGHSWMQGDNAVDGWPGPAFYTTLWVFYQVQPAEVVARAQQVADGDPAIYLMDSTTSRPFEDTWDRDGDGGDCSDYLAYMFMRGKSGQHDWKNSKGQRMWVECSNLAGMIDAGGGWLVSCEPCAENAPFVVVYPDYKKNGKRRQGHVGLVTEVKEDGSWWGYDCSSSQGKKGDAIRFRDLSFFKRKKATRVARASWWITLEQAA